jgi:hypothetical protein
MSPDDGISSSTKNPLESFLNPGSRSIQDTSNELSGCISTSVSNVSLDSHQFTREALASSHICTCLQDQASLLVEMKRLADPKSARRIDSVLTVTSKVLQSWEVLLRCQPCQRAAELKSQRITDDTGTDLESLALAAMNANNVLHVLQDQVQRLIDEMHLLPKAEAEESLAIAPKPNALHQSTGSTKSSTHASKALVPTRVGEYSTQPSETLMLSVMLLFRTVNRVCLGLGRMQEFGKLVEHQLLSTYGTKAAPLFHVHTPHGDSGRAFLMDHHRSEEHLDIDFRSVEEEIRQTRHLRSTFRHIEQSTWGLRARIGRYANGLLSK